jgi:hypothetical protein
MNGDTMISLSVLSLTFLILKAWVIPGGEAHFLRYLREKDTYDAGGYQRRPMVALSHSCHVFQNSYRFVHRKSIYSISYNTGSLTNRRSHECSSSFCYIRTRQGATRLGSALPGSYIIYYPRLRTVWTLRSSCARGDGSICSVVSRRAAASVPVFPRPMPR